MNMHLIDWLCIAGVLALFVAMSVVANRMTKSVADYLVAGRTAGRYMLTVSSGTEWIGVIAISAMFELFYTGGLNAMWWPMFTTPIIAYVQITGFGMYRFRETRAMTVAEYLERRYSRPVRTVGAIISWISGIIAFGFVPLITGKFLMAMIGLPAKFALWGMDIPTYPVVTLFVVGLPLMFVFTGGHLTVLVSNFVQGMFMNIAALALVFTVLSMKFDWDQIVFTMKMDPGLFNPTKASNAQDFGPMFFIIAAATQVYSTMSNIAAQGFQGSAKSAHELRMGNLLAQIRWQGILIFFAIFALVTTAIMKHPANAETADQIRQVLDAGISANDKGKLAGNVTETQMVVPAALAFILPHGMIGLFCAMMVAALISSSNAMTHAWGSVLMQDIILPFRKRPLTPQRHIWALRGSVLFVAIITFLLSLLIKPTENIMQCLALFGVLFLGPAGAVILGGLYWKHGTTRAAMTTFIVGAVLGVLSIFFTQAWGMITQTYTTAAFSKPNTTVTAVLHGTRSVDALVRGAISEADQARLRALSEKVASVESAIQELKSANAAPIQIDERKAEAAALHAEEAAILVNAFNKFSSKDAESVYSHEFFKDVMTEEKTTRGGQTTTTVKPAVDAEYANLLRQTAVKNSAIANRMALAKAYPEVAAEEKYPIRGQWSYLGAALICTLVYILISLFDRQPTHNMDRLLHRGAYAIKGEPLVHDRPVVWWQWMFGITRMFTREDRFTAYFLMGYFLLTFAIFVGGMSYGAIANPSDDAWLTFWIYFLIFQLFLLVVTTIWLGWGGVRDLFRLFADMKSKPHSTETGAFIETSNNDHQP